MTYEHVITNAQTGEVTVVPFTQQEIDAYNAAHQPQVPSSVSMRQARLALLQSGLLSTVDAAIASGTDADKITWEYATEVSRTDAMVANMSTALGLTENQLDQLFTLAATL